MACVFLHLPSSQLTNSANFHNLRDMNVSSGTGGLATFSSEDSKTWPLGPTASLDTKLTAANDASSAPDTQTVKYLRPEHAIPGVEKVELSERSDNPSKDVRFLYEALSSVVRNKRPIANWNDNEYTCLAVLAKSIDTNETAPSALVYRRGTLMKNQALIATATLEYIKMKDLEIMGTSDEDEEMEWANDREVLLDVSGLYNLQEHPLFAGTIQALRIL